MNFIDRQSADPGRFKVSPENGNPYYATLERADGAIVAGTPLNAATFNAMFAELCGYVNARNLVDNSNFANPVNQRDYDLYADAAQYTIDRWKATVKLSVAVGSGYLELECAGDATLRNSFAQYFAAEKTPAPGTAITAAYCSNGVVYAQSGIMPESGNIALGDGDLSVTGFRLYSEAEGARIALMVPPGDKVTVEWIAVYEGTFTAEDLPVYRPKDYSAELMECMRYYQILSDALAKPIDLRPTMVSTPTMIPAEKQGAYAYSAEP